MSGFDPYFEGSSDEFTDEQSDTKEDSEVDEKTTSNEIGHCCDMLLGTDKVLRLSCCVHTLRMVVSDGFKESSSITMTMAFKYQA